MTAASFPLSFPMRNTQVEMNFDGHPINLFVDSASFISYLVYGGWYERFYGPDSCEKLASGCYFCPSTDPCDLDSLRTQKIRKVYYGAGKTDGAARQTDEFVMRTVTLKVGEREIKDLQIGLLVGSTRLQRDIQPYAVLGITLPPPNSVTGVLCPPLLGQLVKAGVIPQTTFSVRVSKFSVGITGELVLGDSAKKPLEMTVFSLGRPSWNKVASALSASAIRVRSPSGKDQVIEFSNQEAYLSVVIDTGTDDTIVPKRVFSMILEAIEAEVGRGRVADSPEAAQAAKLKRLDAFVSSAGWIKVRKKVLGKLPVLVIQGESGSAFEMHLTHHVHSCEGEWCRLLVTSRLRADDSFDNFILGAPFFAEHDVYIDLYRGFVGLSTPTGAVVKEIPSQEQWASIRQPPCRRKEEHRSIMSRIFRRPGRNFVRD